MGLEEGDPEQGGQSRLSNSEAVGGVSVGPASAFWCLCRGLVMMTEQEGSREETRVEAMELSPSSQRALAERNRVGEHARSLSKASAVG